MNTGTLLYVVVLVAAFYFLIIRPQQQRQRETRELMAALSTGDRVITVGGMHGTVVKVLDSTVILRVLDNSEIEFEKAAIGRITQDVPPVADDEPAADCLLVSGFTALFEVLETVEQAAQRLKGRSPAAVDEPLRRRGHAG